MYGCEEARARARHGRMRRSWWFLGYSERRGGCEEGTDKEGRRIRTEEIRSTSRESVDGISVSG